MAQVWAGLQLDYDMAPAVKQADRIKVQRVFSTPVRAA